MEWYFYIALIVTVLQLLLVLLTYRNYRYAIAKSRTKHLSYRPRTVLIIPCKGLDSGFEENITSFFNQDYDNHLLWFVVGEESDSAYGQLCRLKDKLAKTSKANDVQVMVAGHTKSCSQKIHNLLYCYKRIGPDVEVLAFADSDACIRSDWLTRLVHPLRKSKYGAASGYRWFVPKKNNIASLALSAANAKIVQLLGNSPFNQAWGGSMAVRVELFRQLGLDKIWSNALSDDFTLSCSVKKAKKKIAFVPACLVASCQSTTWPELFEFGRRQFLITRVTAVQTWWLGLCSCLFSVFSLWGIIALTAYTAAIGAENTPYFILLAILLLASQITRAIIRQTMISKLLAKNRSQMKFAIAADIAFFWVWSLLLLTLMLSSAFGRTISWRGIRYKLLSPTETIVLDN